MENKCYVCRILIDNRGDLTKAQKDDLVFEILHHLYHKEIKGEEENQK